MGKRIRLLFGISMMMFTSVFAQKSAHTLQQADKAYDRLQFDAAIKLYEKYYANDSGNTKVILRLGDAYWNVRDYEKSFNWYNLAPADTIQSNLALTRRLAELNAMKGNYEYAAEKLNSVNGFQERAEGFKYKDEFLKDSADWNLGYLNINTKTFREFSPLIFRDKFIWSTNELVTKSRKGIMGWDANGYIRQVYINDLAQLESTDFPGPDTVQTVIDSTIKRIARHYAGADVSLTIPKSTFMPAKRKDSVLQRFPELKGLEGVYYNVAHATASNETGKIYLSANRQEKLRSNATRKLGIVEGDVDGDYITNTRFLPLVQEDPSTAEDVVMHGAIDPSGQYLIYSSNQLGGKGGYDLYMVKKIPEDQSWSTPVPLTEINTPGNEVFSAFSPNGDLFFSSDGHPGLGGLDIYRVGFERGTITSDVEHLSFPVNSSADDFGMIFTDNGRVGFFTTDRYGSDDIIAFDYKRKCTPMKGTVLEQGTNAKRANVPVYMYQKDRKGVQMLVDSAVTNSDGVYNFSCGRPNRNYVVYVHEPRVENIAPKMIAFDVLVPPSTNPIDLPIAYISTGKAKQPPVFAKAPSTLVDSNYLKFGMHIDTSWLVKHEPHPHQKVVLDSVYFIIYFDFDKYALKQQSIATLNKATDYLKQNPNNGFILLGHTDLKGNPTYNINLSRNRVFAAKKYMTAKGIEPRRLEAEYFGQKFPVKRALTPEAGKLNRRVEFILIKK